MASTKEEYNKQKAAEQVRAQEAQRRYKAEQAESQRRYEAHVRTEQEAESRRNALEAEKDRQAKQYLDNNVVDRLKDLRSETGGKVITLNNRKVRLEIKSKEVVYGTLQSPEERNIYHNWSGVEVSVHYDENNKGHLYVNSEKVSTNNLDQALSQAALHPTSGQDQIQEGIKGPRLGELYDRPVFGW